PPTANFITADGLGGFDRKAADEDGEALEQHAVRWVQEVVAPVDDVAERLLPEGMVTRAFCQQRQAALQSCSQRLGREELDAGRRELDGHRQAVQAPA